MENLATPQPGGASGGKKSPKRCCNFRKIARTMRASKETDDDDDNDADDADVDDDNDDGDGDVSVLSVFWGG